MMHIAEDVRMQELLATEILDTPRNARFDEILDQLCEELDCSYARLSFIDKERIWIKSKRGISVQEFPRAGSIEEILLEKELDIIELSQDDIESISDPFDFKNKGITEVFAVAIRSQSLAIVGCLVMAFKGTQTFGVEFKNLLISTSAKYAELLETRRVADSLLATLRDQQEEIRIRYSSERIARTLTSTVTDRDHYYQVIEAFTQTVLNEFDWWACQIWFETDGQLVPEKWIFGPSAPRSIFNLEKIFTSPFLSPSNEETLSLPYTSTVSPVLDAAGVLWAKQNSQLEELGLRTFLDVNVAGASTTAIRLLFVLPSSRVLPTRLRLTFENVIAQLPQLIRRARSVEELNYRATHDELTGLLNRRGLEVEFAQIPSHEGIKRSKTIFFLDLDRFKSVNDTYGHQIGDELLVEISHRLMKSSRPVDAIARIGGDEFVIVAQGFDQSDDIATTSNRFLHNLSEPFIASDGTGISPKVSIGISTWDSIEELTHAVTQADKNMYAAKNRGGNQAVSDGWASTDSFGLESGENYAISYRSINNKDGSRLVGVLTRVKLPAFFAPRMISEISGQIYQNASLRNVSNSSEFILLLDIAATSRSDRANTLSLVDSITELVSKKFKVVSVVNLDSRTLDGTPIAREIIGHGNATIALGSLFDKPFEVQLIEELRPTFLIRSSSSIDWDRSDEPVLADRAALSLSAEIGIPTILPAEYAKQYGEYLEKFASILYLNNEEES